MGVLDGQVALVTGCGRMKGLGRGIATAFAREGADVVVSDVVAEGTRNAIDSNDEEAAANWRGLPSLVAEIEAMNRKAVAVVGDVGLARDADRMVTEGLAAFGRIDILVNNAGAPHGLDRDWTWQVPEEAFDNVMRINTKGVFLMASAVARHMIERGGPGRIVNISSNAGRVGVPKRAAYCASKFAIIGLTQVLAAELASRQITVNAICPGWIDTPRYASTSTKAAQGGEAFDQASIGTPVGRIGRPEDIAAAVTYLASPAASFVTGQSLGVDGGMLMR